MIGVPSGACVVAGPLDAAEPVELLVAHAGEGRREPRDLVHDLATGGVVHGVAERVGQSTGDLPVLAAGQRRHDLAHARDAPLGVGEGAVLLQERRAGQEHVAYLAVSFRNRSCTTRHSMRGKRRGHVLRVGVGLRRMSSPWTYRPLKLPSSAASNMLGMRRPGSGSSATPHASRTCARVGVVGDVPVAGQLVRERAHVAGALHVVLAAQRVHAHALAAEVAGGHGEVGDGHHHGRALAVLGDAQAVVDGAVAAGGIEPRRAADQLGRHAGDLLHRFGRCAARRRSPSSPRTRPSRSARARMPR